MLAYKQNQPKRYISKDSNYKLAETSISFTDSSKTDHSLYGMNPKPNISKKYELPTESSISTTEVTAVYQAMKYILHYSMESKHMIFTDGKSTVDRIKNIHPRN